MMRYMFGAFVVGIAVGVAGMWLWMMRWMGVG
jgi:hypothetical protein